MMQISCVRCGKKYKIDDAKLVKPVTKLKCKQCSGIIRVVKPGAKAESPPPPEAAAKTPEPKKKKGKKKEEKKTKKGKKTRAVRFGLVSKVITVMLFVSLVPFGLFVGMTFKQTRERLQADTQALMAQTAEGLGSRVDQWVENHIRVLRAAAKMPVVQSMNGVLQTPVAEAIHGAYPYVYLVFTLDANGANTARSDGKALRDYSDRQFYKDIVGGKKLSWQTLIDETSKKPALVLAVPIMKNDRMVGVLAGAMTLDDISRYVARWQKGQTGFAFLVDDQGNVVAHQNRRFVTSQKNLNTHPLVAAYRSSRQPHAVTFSENGELMRGYVRGNQFGWVLAIAQSEAEMFAEHKSAEQFAIYLLGITVALVLLIAYWAARTLVQPINELTDVADRMSMGEFDLDINVRSKDEIGQLARSVGRMQTSLRLAIERLRKRP